MLKKVLLLSMLFLIILAASVLLVNNLQSFLFQSVPWFLPVSMATGLILGGHMGMSKNTSGLAIPAGMTKRHNISSFLEHWGTASGLFMLMISGLLLYVSPSLMQGNLHFLGILFTLFFGSYFFADFFTAKKFNYLLPNFTDIFMGTAGKYFFRVKWIDNGKYLASQKSAFLAFTTLGIGITLTGFIKLAGILWHVPTEMIKIATPVHDITSVLFVVLVFLHVLLVLANRSHRRLLRSWFTDTVPENIPKAELPRAVETVNKTVEKS